MLPILFYSGEQRLGDYYQFGKVQQDHGLTKELRV